MKNTNTFLECRQVPDTGIIEVFSKSQNGFVTFADVHNTPEFKAVSNAAFLVWMINNISQIQSVMDDLAVALRKCLSGKRTEYSENEARKILHVYDQRYS